MRTEIGRGLRGTRARLATGIGLIAVGLDMTLVQWGRYPENVDGRWAVVVASLAAQTWLAGGDLPSLGLCAPIGGWWQWARTGVRLGLVVAAFLGVAAGLWLAAGARLPIVTVPPASFFPAFLRMCVFAPLLEEPVYRVALCVPLASLAGPRWAMIASGTMFGLLHVVYGNPSPENLLGGFFLAWAYLRSGSACMPVLLHSAGNLLALLGQTGAWFWAGGQA